MSLLSGVLGLLVLVLAIVGALALDSPQLNEARAEGRTSWFVAVGGTTLLVLVAAVATYVRLNP